SDRTRNLLQAAIMPALLVLVRREDRLKAAGSVRQLDADVLELLRGSRIGAFPCQANTTQRHLAQVRTDFGWHHRIDAPRLRLRTVDIRWGSGLNGLVEQIAELIKPFSQFGDFAYQFFYRRPREWLCSSVQLVRRKEPRRAARRPI